MTFLSVCNPLYDSPLIVKKLERNINLHFCDSNCQYLKYYYSETFNPAVKQRLKLLPKWFLKEFTERFRLYYNLPTCTVHRLLHQTWSIKDVVRRDWHIVNKWTKYHPYEMDNPGRPRCPVWVCRTTPLATSWRAPSRGHCQQSRRSTSKLFWRACR